MRRANRILAFAAMLSLAVPSAANASIACQFNVNAVAVDWAANLNVTLTNSGTSYWWYVCNVQGTVNVTVMPGTSGPVTSGACNVLYSQFLTARASGQPVQLWFVNATACTAAGGLPSPGTFMSPNFPSNFVF